MTVANTRIPYFSTLQLEDEEAPADGPKAVKYGLAADEKGKAIKGAPANPSPQPFVRGEKQWMDNGQNIMDWEDNQVKVANTRLPYASTFAQLSDSDEVKSDDIEKIFVLNTVPLTAEFVQLTPNDSDPAKMESMVLEELDIPMNMRLVHIENNQGDGLVRII